MLDCTENTPSSLAVARELKAHQRRDANHNQALAPATMLLSSQVVRVDTCTQHVGPTTIRFASRAAQAESNGKREKGPFFRAVSFEPSPVSSLELRKAPLCLPLRHMPDLLERQQAAIFGHADPIRPRTSPAFCQ